MGQIMIIIGIICAALAAWLIPHGYYLYTKQQTVEQQKNTQEDRDIKHKEQMAYLELLPEVSSGISDIKQTISDENKRKKQLYYEVGSLEEKDGGYYRAIKIRNEHESHSQYNFVVEIKGNEVFRKEVNGPRPVGGGPIKYVAPSVRENICEVTIVEIGPKETILVGLASDKKWDLVNIKGYIRK